MDGKKFLVILLMFSLGVSLFFLLFQKNTPDYRTSAAKIVARAGKKGALIEKIIFHKGIHTIYNTKQKRWTNAEGNAAEGIAIYVFPTSKIKAWVEFKEGLPHGRSVVYFLNGKIKEITTFRNGVKEGKYVRFNRMGQKFIEGQFLHGQMQGQWKLLFPDGSIRYRATYQQGKVIEEWFGEFTGFSSIPWESEE